MAARGFHFDGPVISRPHMHPEVKRRADGLHENLLNEEWHLALIKNFDALKADLTKSGYRFTLPQSLEYQQNS